MTPNRRRPTTDKHAMTIRLIAGRLVPMCRCGAIVGGNRYNDTNMISLADLLELVRLHSQDPYRR